MKKVIITVMVIVFGVLIFNSVLSNETKAQEDISSKLIRFHVIANSDSKEDQDLKLKVRDKILEYISPKLKNSKDINESRKILKENEAKLIKISEGVITSNGYSYSVKSTLDKENFPVKTYGNITLPEGNYEAYRIVIGNGDGKNWWCVMFPPLCFVDISVGQVSYAETEKQMKRVLTEGEYKLVNNLNVDKKNSCKV